MRKTTTGLLCLAAAIAAGALSPGCSTGQTQQRKPAAATTTAAEPAPRQTTAPRSAYGPSHSSSERDGVRYVTGSLAFPSGTREGSGLLLEKTVPAEIMVGQPVQYVYTLRNLTKAPLTQIVVKDRVSSNFAMQRAEPQPTETKDGVVTWAFDDLAPDETATIRVTGVMQEEGIATTCGWATYSPLLCESIRALRADLQLVKEAPEEVILCDAIPMRLVVRNTGSSVLTNVRVTDTLPAGLRTESGEQTATFDAGNLQPDQAREFTFNAKASETGEFVNTAKAASAQGVEAEASAKTIVRAPALKLTCEADEMRLIGRPGRFVFTLANEGDAVSKDTILEVPVPAGATVTGTSEGGQISGNSIVWRIGELEAQAVRKFAADMEMNQPGTIEIRSSASGYCADVVQSTCTTRVTGIPAILLEVVDLEDPIEVGGNVVYEISVTNQGSAPGTNIKVICTWEDAQEFVSVSTGQLAGRNPNSIEFTTIPSLAPKAKTSTRITMKALETANVRFKVSIMSDQITRPVEETESTNQY